MPPRYLLSFAVEYSLWTWALLTLTIVWLALAAVAYYTGLDEADEILDGHLVSVAEPLLQPPARLLKAPPQSATPPARSTYATVYAPELRLVVWEDERVVWDTHGIATLLPASLPPGHHTLVLASIWAPTWPKTSFVPRWSCYRWSHC